MQIVFTILYIASIFIFIQVTNKSTDILNNKTTISKVNGFIIQVVLGIMGLYVFIVSPVVYFILALGYLIAQLFDDILLGVKIRFIEIIVYFLFFPGYLGIRAFFYLNSNQRF